MASGWITIANAVAEKYGVEDDLFVRDRIGSINEDRLNDHDVSAREFKNGQEAVQFGGQGVGGNAVARFGVDDGASRDAAEEFASIINAFKQLGLAEDVLVNDDLNFNTLAEGFGAYFTRELINPSAPDPENGVKGSGAFNPVDTTRDFTKTFENSDVVDIDYEARLQSAGIGGGGNARAVFEEEADRDAFVEAVNAANSTEVLGVKDSGQSGTWNALAEDADTIFTRDTFTFNREGIDLGDDPEIELQLREIEENGWTVQIGGQGIGGNAAAKFNTEAEALAFEALVDDLIALGLTDELFG